MTDKEIAEAAERFVDVTANLLKGSMAALDKIRVAARLYQCGSDHILNQAARDLQSAIDETRAIIEKIQIE